MTTARHCIIVTWGVLFTTFFTLTGIALTRSMLDALWDAHQRRIEDGQICSRLFHRNLMSVLDKKRMAQAWQEHLETSNSTLQKAIMEDYHTTFYKVPDRSIDFEKMSRAVKELAQRKASPDDFMIALRKCVTDQAFFDQQNRKRMWSTYWNEPERRQKWVNHFGHALE